MTTRCPLCNASPCYISFISGNVECSNPACVKYSKDLYPPPPSVSKPEEASKEEKISHDEDDVDDSSKIRYFWSNYHTDCGDV